MTAPAGELATAGSGLVALTYLDYSAPTLMDFDGSRYMWWRFTAPTDGVFPFDLLGSQVPGVTSTADIPYTGFTIANTDGSPFDSADLYGGFLDGTSVAWVALRMTAGQSVDIGVVAISSLDDYLGSANIPTLVSLRSTDRSAATDTELIPEMVWSQSYDADHPTGTFPTLSIEYPLFMVMAVNSGGVAATSPALDAWEPGQVWLANQHFDGGTSTASTAHWLSIADQFGLSFELDFHGEVGPHGKWMAAIFDMKSGVIGRTYGWLGEATDSVLAVNTRFPTLPPFTPASPGDPYTMNIDNVVGEHGFNWVIMVANMGDASQVWFPGSFADPVTFLGGDSTPSAYLVHDASPHLVLEVQPYGEPSIMTWEAIQHRVVYVVTYEPPALADTSIDNAFDLARCRFV